MSRSRRRTPIIGNAVARSDRWTKTLGHHQERAAARAAMADEREPPHRLAYGNPRLSMKDGKHWIGDRHPKLMRK